MKLKKDKPGVNSMIENDDQAEEFNFLKELDRRIDYVTSPTYHDASSIDLPSTDFLLIGLLLVVSTLILMGGWYL